MNGNFNNGYRQWIFAMVVFATIVLQPFGVAAQPVDWSGLGDGTDWHDGDNWNPAGVPGAGAEVTVAAGATILLTDETAELASFNMTGGTLTFSNWMTGLRAGTVHLQGGQLTLPAPFAEGAMSNRVWIVCHDLTLGEYGLINVNGLGYAGSHGPGKTADRGTGGPSAGAGHGGRGGLTTQLLLGGSVYGEMSQPQTPGSGSGSTSHYAGRDGGGVVHIDATGHVQVNGVISADGLAGVEGFSSRHVGGAAGGSIWIRCETFGSDSGQIHADGGDGYATAAQSSGGGAGGRIAIEYNASEQASMPASTARFTVEPGRGGAFHPLESTARMLADGNAYIDRTLTADWGSLYFSDASGVVEISETGLNLSGYVAFANQTTNFTLNALSLANTYLGFDTSAVLSITGTLSTDANSGLLTRHPLQLSVDDTIVLRGESRFNSAVNLVCGGELALEESASVSFAQGSALGIGGGLTVSGASVNLLLKGVDAAITGNVQVIDGAWLAVMGHGEDGTVGDAAMRLTTENDLLLGVDSWIYVYSDPVLGGSPYFQCQNLNVAEESGINGDARGYGHGNGPGSSASASGSGHVSGGAGHGGIGGLTSTLQPGGPVDGSIVQPRIPGSSSGNTMSGKGSSGGSVVRIDVTAHAQVDGTISTDGGPGAVIFSDRNTGGGAGGSIWLTCETFAGNGWIRAEGGGGAQSGGRISGGGGGGRIAIHYDTARQAALPPPGARFTVNPGRGDAFHPLQATTLTVAGHSAYIDRSLEADWGSLYFSDASGVVEISETDLNFSGHITFGNNITNFTLNALSLKNTHLGFDTNAVLTINGTLSTDANSGLLARHPLQLSIDGDTVLRGESRFDGVVNMSGGGGLYITDTASVSFGPASLLTIAGGLTLTGENVNLMLKGMESAITGDIQIADGAWLAAMGYGTDDTVGDAAMRLMTEGDLSLAQDGWIYVYSDPALGGSPVFESRNLSIAADSGINGDGRGYVNAGPGLGGGSGHAIRGGGGGHGGKGGDSHQRSGGITNDCVVWPQWAGSSGGYNNDVPGGRGGSAIRMRIRQRAAINGTVTANGSIGPQGQSNRNAGGGAGGTIRLVVGSLSGIADAVISANGGIGVVATPTDGAGGGGGGIIAVYTDFPSGITDFLYARLLAGDLKFLDSANDLPGFSGVCSVAGGAGYEDGDDGSIRFFLGPPRGTIIMMR